MPAVYALEARDVPVIVEVVAESFFDYPVMRYVVGPAEDYPDRLRTFVHFIAMARVLRREPMFGIGDRSDLDGVALVSRPGVPSPEEVGDLREALWERLGSEARARYEAFGAATSAFEPNAPHIHLNTIGVRNRGQGAGFGRALLEHVHAVSRDDPTSTGVSLTTENPANVSLYQHFGYEIVGQATVGSGLRTWGFFRPDHASGSS